MSLESWEWETRALSFVLNIPILVCEDAVQFPEAAFLKEDSSQRSISTKIIVDQICLGIAVSDPPFDKLYPKGQGLLPFQDVLTPIQQLQQYK